MARRGADCTRRGGTIGCVQTRYLIIAALVTALVILAATALWFVMGIL